MAIYVSTFISQHIKSLPRSNLIFYFIVQDPNDVGDDDDNSSDSSNGSPYDGPTSEDAHKARAMLRRNQESLSRFYEQLEDARRPGSKYVFANVTNSIKTAQKNIATAEATINEYNNSLKTPSQKKDNSSSYDPNEHCEV